MVRINRPKTYEDYVAEQKETQIVNQVVEVKTEMSQVKTDVGALQSQVPANVLLFVVALKAFIITPT